MVCRQPTDSTQSLPTQEGLIVLLEKNFFVPKQVLTPGSNFLEPSESSDDDEEESDNREEAQTDDAEERDVNLGFLADTSTVIECNSA